MPVPHAFRAPAVAALILAVPAMAGAQTAPPAPSPVQSPAARCQALLGRLPVSGLASPASEALPDGGCRFTNLRIGSDRFGYQAATVTEHGVPADISSSPPAVPTNPLDAQVAATGIFFSLHSGNARVDWLNRQQQLPFDANLDVAYDPAHGDLTLRKLALDGAGIGAISLAVDATGLYDRTFPGRVQFRAARLHLDSRRVLATFVLASLSNMLPENDPEGAYKALKAQAIAGLRALLPLAHASADTTAALVAFAEDFPHPTRVLDLSVTATPSVTLDEAVAAATDPARTSAVLGKLTITATYAGEAH